MSQHVPKWPVQIWYIATPRPTPTYPDLPPTYPSKQKLKALAVKIITVIST